MIQAFLIKVRAKHYFDEKEISVELGVKDLVEFILVEALVVLKIRKLEEIAYEQCKRV